MHDQPTPPPSLEEARQFMRDWLADCGLPYDKQDSHFGVDESLAKFEAAARAEVIREVEALHEHSYPECYGNYNDPTRPYCGKPEATLGDVVARLCALSQGGEGKA